MDVKTLIETEAKDLDQEWKTDPRWAGIQRTFTAHDVVRLRLEESDYDVVLSGGTFRAVPTLAQKVVDSLAAPPAHVALLEDEPAMGAVKLALEELRADR